MSSDFPGLTNEELEARGAAWTAREIAQQPRMWTEVERLIAGRRARLDRFLSGVLEEATARVILTGAGSSAFIGESLAPALSARLGRRVDAIATTELVSGPHLWLQGDAPTLLVSFARSGNSPESVASVDLGERLLGNVHHLIITCNADGQLARRGPRLRRAEVLVLPEATNDRGFAMTSSFSSMLLAAALTFGVIPPSSVQAMAQAAGKLLRQAGPLAQGLAARGFTRMVCLGSNELRGLAREAALKLLELTDGRLATLADSTLGFRHGPKAVIDERTLVVVMLSNSSYTRAYDLDLLRELRRDARAACILALSARNDDLEGGDHLLFEGMDAASDIELGLLHVVVAQSYALLQSLALGLTPDRPNAAGLVNRVVQGVTIHPWPGTEHGAPGP